MSIIFQRPHSPPDAVEEVTLHSTRTPRRNRGSVSECNALRVLFAAGSSDCLVSHPFPSLLITTSPFLHLNFSKHSHNTRHSAWTPVFSSLRTHKRKQGSSKDTYTSWKGACLFYWHPLARRFKSEQCLTRTCISPASCCGPSHSS